MKFINFIGTHAIEVINAIYIELSNQFKCPTLHVVVNVNVALGGGDVGVTHKACKQANADTFIGQCCDEGAATAVTTTPSDTCALYRQWKC